MDGIYLSLLLMALSHLCSYPMMKKVTFKLDCAENTSHPFIHFDWKIAILRRSFPLRSRKECPGMKTEIEVAVVTMTESPIETSKNQKAYQSGKEKDTP